ncbi:MAG: peptide-methionine (S)-S-oxide reductase MsrA [Flavisolibacter sp.]
MRVFMRDICMALACLIICNSCVQSQGKDSAVPQGSGKPGPHEAVATFGEGCFWHAEIIFQSLEGVRDAVSGYAGGHTKQPGYEEVSTGRTGHAECVQVYYDPSVISFETLLKAFFASHDPTSLNRQGPDEGTQYRSIVFYRNEKEQQQIENEMKILRDARRYHGKIVTEVKPFTVFYRAEDEHQEYIYHHPGNPYVQTVSLPDYFQFRKNFPGPFKKGIL